MGQEISEAGFEEADFAAFSARLKQETALLRSYWADGILSCDGPRIGFELEAWLIDRNCIPAPHNQSFLNRLADPLVVAELSRFNIEINGTPQMLAGQGLGALERELHPTLERCAANAHDDVDTIIAIGTLPTLRESDLSLANMTPSNRYVALNREVFRARGGAPLEIHIDSAVPGGAPLHTTHEDVMLEAATTSFQLHLQVPHDRIAAALNASSMLSAPLLAIAANSPFLFGQPLWHETRIAIFEQALGMGDGPAGTTGRVNFGDCYLGDDPTQLFAENIARFPPLLPVLPEDGPERLRCVHLHNGTIWRWNRLLVGFDEDRTPHLRIENRILPAGPTVSDMMANAALYFGAVQALGRIARQAEEAMPFEVARANFYAAARQGLGAEIIWLDGKRQPVRAVIAELVQLARDGLAEQGVAEELAERYLDTIECRLASGQNGAQWQLAHYAKYGDVFRLTADYAEHQRSSMAVHEWTI